MTGIDTRSEPGLWHTKPWWLRATLTTNEGVRQCIRRACGHLVVRWRLTVPEAGRPALALRSTLPLRLAARSIAPDRFQEVVFHAEDPAGPPSVACHGGRLHRPRPDPGGHLVRGRQAGQEQRRQPPAARERR